MGGGGGAPWAPLPGSATVYTVQIPTSRMCSTLYVYAAGCTHTHHH